LFSYEYSRFSIFTKDAADFLLDKRDRAQPWSKLGLFDIPY
jgi:hypothetical protein